MPKQINYSVHWSDVQRFKECRWAWDCASPSRRNLTPRDRYAPFFTGSMMHHVLEMRYRFDTPPFDAINSFLAQEAQLAPIDASDPQIYDQINLVLGIAKHYDLWQHYDQTMLADANFEFVAPEQDFITPLWSNSRKRINLVGRFDGVVKHLSSGKLYLWELKTTRSLIERERQLALDGQADCYINAASRILDQPIYGVVYTLMRKKVPDFPKVISNGTLSVVQSQDTTAEWFLDCVKQHHSIGLEVMSVDQRKAFIKNHYSELLNYLTGQPNKYFSRLIVQRSESELNQSWRELQDVAREMISKPTIYRTDGPHCNYCLFRTPCIAQRQARDHIAILQSDYVFNERYANEASA
jgi:hypothetical protein